MKKIYLLCSFLFTVLEANSQCMTFPVSFSDRMQNAGVIVEGKVVAKNSYWNSSQNFIYTSNIIDVYKIFKGNFTSNQVEIITEGGIVGSQKIVVEPSLQLKENQVGIFFLAPPVYSNPLSPFYPAIQFECYAAEQGFIKYDLISKTAVDPFGVYNNIINDIYLPIAQYRNQPYIEIAKFDINNQTNQGQNFFMVPPVISSITPGTSTAGTFSLVTVGGNNFGNGPFGGTRSLEWRDANNGGAGFIGTPANHIVSWTSTSIQAWVPTQAGSGTIRVTNDLSESTVSGMSITINYNESNVVSGGVYYQPDLVNDNGIGGYTYRYSTPLFSGNAAAVAAFERALQTWRCGTFVNFDRSGTTAVTCQALDGTNLVTFDGSCGLPAGVLGVSYSYYASCAAGVWYLNENDLKFRTNGTGGITWQYGPALCSGPPVNDYDFESVCLHELGHSHQLGHTILPVTVMNYAISNDIERRTLTPVSETAGGNDIMSRSVVNNACAPTAMIALNASNCAIAAPVADFSGTPLTGCNSLTVTFTDLSTNAPTAWTWTFTGGAPNSFVGQNPPGILYAAPGTYTVTLVVSNAFGNDTETKTNYIVVNNCPPPVADFYGSPTTVCEGQQVSFFDLSTNTPTSWSWTFPGGTPGASAAQNPVITYNTAGVYNVTLTATNPYGNNTLTKNTYITVNSCPPAPVANFSGTPLSFCAGGTVTFTDLSTNAPTSWNWTFPGGTPSTSIAQNPGITYNTPGTYSVTLTSTNSGGSNTITMGSYITVTLCSAPNVNFAGWPRTVCEGQTVSFADMSSNTPASWNWTFPGGTPASSPAQNPVVTYNTAGTYDVTLQAFNVWGNNTLTQTNYIVVSVCPPPGSGLIVNDGSLVFSQPGALITVEGGVINQDNGGYIGEWDNTGLITLTGDWTNNSTANAFINASPGTFQLLGANQLITGSTPSYFYNLTLSGTGIKTQTVNARVLGTLALNDRELATQGNVMYVTNAAAGAITRTGGFNSTPVQGFVSSTGTGRLWRETNSANTYLFPVGSGIGIPRYRPVEIRPSAAAVSTYGVRFVNNDANIDGFNRNLKDPTLGVINPLWYQKINRVSGSTAANITLYCDNVLDGFAAMATLQMTEWGYTVPPVIWKHIIGNSAIGAASPALSSVTKALWNNFSTENFNIAPQSQPLPVELLSFTAECNPGKNAILLKWITASEINNDYFTIEKSYNGKDFEVIGKIDGAGTTPVLQTYFLEDKNITGKNVIYYRLKQTDFNGVSFTFGIIASGCSDIHTPFNVLNIYPNPFMESIVIDMILGSTSNFSIELTDIIGRKILSESYSLQSGFHKMNFNFSQLAPGAYSLTFVSENGKEVHKIIKME